MATPHKAETDAESAVATAIDCGRIDGEKRPGSPAFSYAKRQLRSLFDKGVAVRWKKVKQAHEELGVPV